MSEGAPIAVTRNEGESAKIISKILESVAELKNLGMNTEAIERDLALLQNQKPDDVAVNTETKYGLSQKAEWRGISDLGLMVLL